MKILFAYDGSQCAEDALADFTRAGLPRAAEVCVLTVVDELAVAPVSVGGMTTTFPEVLLAEQKQARASAQQTCARLHAQFTGWQCEAEMRVGSASSEILALADAWHPELIVVGSHGRTALGRFFFGSVSQKVLNDAHCSVRIARGRVVTPPSTPVRLVVGVDGSPGAEAAVQAIAARVWPPGSEVRIVHAAWMIPPMADASQIVRVEEWIAEENARVETMTASALERLSAAGLKTSRVMREQEPKRLLLHEAEAFNADGIVVGAKGLGQLERLLIGSVSSGVAARAHCSVEVVRH
jgi:nucleotide-binding universal stress UspA family protein